MNDAINIFIRWVINGVIQQRRVWLQGALESRLHYEIAIVLILHLTKCWLLKKLKIMQDPVVIGR